MQLLVFQQVAGSWGGKPGVCAHAHLCLEDTGAQEWGDLVKTLPFARWKVLPRSAEMTWTLQPSGPIGLNRAHSYID